MELRIAQQHEYDMLEELISHAYLRTLQDELDDQLFGLQSLAIAWDGKQPKGYGFIYWPGPRELGVADLFPGCPEIFRMTVMPKYQSAGIGSKIVYFLEDQAKSKGYASIGLAVADDNTRAAALYRRLGYAETVANNFTASYKQEGRDASVETITERCTFLQKLL